MIENLERLILHIEASLATVPEVGEADWRDNAKWKARHEAIHAIIDDLVVNERAKYRAGMADAFVFNLAGIRSSCTGGDHGLLTSWTHTARRRIAAEKAVAA